MRLRTYGIPLHTPPIKEVGLPLPAMSFPDPADQDNADIEPLSAPPVYPEGQAARDAAAAAADLRETAERVAEATARLQERWHETEGLIARSESAQAETEQQIHEAEGKLHDTHEMARQHHEHADHGNRLLGTKRPDQSFSEPSTPRGPDISP